MTVRRAIYRRGLVCLTKNDATLKQIAAVKPIVSNVNHVDRSSNIGAILRGRTCFSNEQMQEAFPHAKVKTSPRRDCSKQITFRPLHFRFADMASA
jgi:hypothetical protein